MSLRLLWLCLLSFSMGLDPIVLKGNQLYNSRTKERFYLKGVAYSPDLYANVTCGGTAVNSIPGEDHFTDEKEPYWSKDIPLLQALGINSVRLYNVDPSKNHDKFMAALESAGIYAVVSSTVTVGPGVLDASKAAVSTPGAGCYTTGLLYSAKLIVRQFAKYNNTLAFVVANEIGQYEDAGGNLKPGYHAIPCVKALVRDLRVYMKLCSCGMRYIPLMYAATDLEPQPNGAKPRDLISQYLTCGEHAVDLYGVNIYTWCAYSSSFATKSTYKTVTDAYRNYNVGMVFSEYGCTYGQFENYYPFTDDPTQQAETSQRTWKQIDTLFSKNMSDVFSGGFAYQYSMSEIIYGMVLLPGYEANQPNIKILPNYYYAQQHFTNVTPPVETADWTAANQCAWKPPIFATKVANTCPTKAQADLLFGGSKFPGPENWSANIPPVPPDSFVECNTYPLSEFDRKENECREGACICREIIPEPRCSVDWSTTNTSAPGVKKLLDGLCGLMYHFSDQDCSPISNTGRYAGCSVEQKANYILGVWFTQVKQQTQCCASLFASDECSQPLEAYINAPDNIPWRGDANFSIQVLGGLPPYRYQWEYAAANSSNFQPLGTLSTTELKQVTTATIGSRLRCVIWDSAFLHSVTPAVNISVAAPLEARNRLTANGTLSEFTTKAEMIANAITSLLLNDTMLQDKLRAADISVANATEEGGLLHFTVVVFLGGPSEKSAAQIETKIDGMIADGSLNAELAALGLGLRVTSAETTCSAPPPAGKNQIRECSKSSPTLQTVDTCNVRCEDGYTGSGSSSFACKYGGWSRNTFECTKIEESESGLPLWVIVVLIVLALLLVGAVFKLYTNYREKMEIKQYYEPLNKAGAINS